MKFSIKDIFINVKKSLMENFIFSAVSIQVFQCFSFASSVLETLIDIYGIWNLLNVIGNYVKKNLQQESLWRITQ